MKMKIKFTLIAIFSSLCLTTVAQITNGIIYKSDKWLDTKAKGSLVKAMENPTYQKVEILKTDKNFKITLGTKILNYVIISSSIFSEFKTDYNVTLNGKNYVLSIVLLPDGKTAIGIEGNWMVADVQDIPVNNTDKIVFKLCNALETEKENGNQYISPMLYKSVQKIYPASSFQFFDVRCKYLYGDKKVLKEIFDYFYDMSSYRNKIAFIQIGMSATEADILSEYINTKPLNNL